MIKSLYKCFQHWSDKGSIYIMSDPHFDDVDCKIMDKNWITPEEHIQKLKTKVHKNDTLICLGDVGNAEWFNQLKCYKVLIKGNHDSGSANYLKQKEFIKEYNDFEETDEAQKKGEIDFYVTRFVRPFIAGYKIVGYFDEVYEGPLFISKKILLSHEPVINDFWFNIHGHDHSNNFYEYKESKHLNVASNIINYDVVSLGDIIKEGYLSDIDDIHRDTIDRATERKKKREFKK